MSFTGEAGRDADSLGQITFQNPGLRIIGGEIGNTTPVASELSSTTESPNPFDGAQPLEDPSASAAEDTAPAPQRRRPIEHAEGPAAPYLDNADWRFRVQHVPKTATGWTVRVENALGKIEEAKVMPAAATDTKGQVIDDTFESNVPESSDAPSEERGKVRWYNPADIARSALTKISNPEQWARRTRIAVVLGGLTTSAVCAFMMYHGTKTGVDHGSLLHMFRGNKPAAPPEGATVGSWHTPDAAHHTGPDTSSPAPETQQPAPQPTETHPMQPEPEHFRTALVHDPRTHRASNVTDWSVNAIRDAAKEAGLNAAQADKLAHNQHNIQLANHGFYTDNASVAHDHNHLLNAETDYSLKGQETAAHKVVHHWQVEHHQPVTNAGAPAETQQPPQTTEMPTHTDAQLPDGTQQPVDAGPSIDAQPQPAPAPQPEHFMGLSAEEIVVLQSSLAVLGAGTLATAGTVAYKARHRTKIEAERDQAWGDVTSHRPGVYQGRHHQPTIPPHVDPTQYWRIYDHEKLRRKNKQAADESESATV